MQHISQTILKKTKTYSWLSLSHKCSNPKFTLTVIPKTDQQRHFFFLDVLTPSQLLLFLHYYVLNTGEESFSAEVGT